VALDFVILGLIAVFAVLGGIGGAAKQIGQLVGLGVAFAVAGPLGESIGPWMANALHTNVAIGSVAATLLVFFIVWVALRTMVAAILRRAMQGDDPDDRSVDRNLGMALSAIKISAAVYIVLCALVFAEKNVTAFGKGLGMSPRDSVAFDLARRYNIFEYTQFPHVKSFIRVAKAAGNPAEAAKLLGDPAFAALNKDPQWKKVVSDPDVKAAVEHGDVQALLQHNAVAKLLSEAQAKRYLAAAAAAAEK